MIEQNSIAKSILERLSCELQALQATAQADANDSKKPFETAMFQSSASAYSTAIHLCNIQLYAIQRRVREVSPCEQTEEGTVSKGTVQSVLTQIEYELKKRVENHAGELQRFELLQQWFDQQRESGAVGALSLFHAYVVNMVRDVNSDRHD